MIFWPNKVLGTVFDLSLGQDHITLIHRNKSVTEWRNDLKTYISEIKNLVSEKGWANDDVFNEIIKKLRAAGYFDVTDVVADVYEGRVAVYSAGIEDNPATTRSKKMALDITAGSQKT